MGRGSAVRVRVSMACGACGRRNYVASKNRQKTPDRLVHKKFCKWCGKHTEHRETK